MPGIIAARTSYAHESCVLDFESGLRLNVAVRALDARDVPVVHVTAEIIRGTMIDGYRRSEVFWRTRNHDDWFVRLVKGQFLELHPTPLEFLGFRDGRVPHFYGDLDGTEMVCAKPRVLEIERRTVRHHPRSG
jgi:hypothetical protein